MRIKHLPIMRKVALSGILSMLMLFFSLGLNAQTVTIGTGTSTNSTSGYPAPYGNWYYGARHQILVLASELSAAGAVAGNITGMQFNVATAQGTALQGFEIKMGTTTATALTSTWLTGLTTVYTSTSYTETSGWNTHAFSTPFTWDGVSNIVIETCFNNSGYTNNAQMYYSTTTFTSVNYYRADASGVCTNSSSYGTSSNRPNMKFTIVPNVSVPTDLGVISWDSPSSGCGLTNAEQVTIKVKNFGTAAQNAYTLKYSIDGGTTWTSQAMTTNIPAGDTLTHTFTTTANLGTVGTYNCQAKVELTGDTVSYNDVLSTTIDHVGFGPGAAEGFESVAAGFTSSYSNGWITYNSDASTGNPKWECEDASGSNENSSNTGPYYDHTSFGTSGGHYMFMETSSPSTTGDTSWLESPCLALGGTPIAIVKFYYHMYGQTMGDLSLEQKINGQWVSTGWSKSGQQQSSGGAAWEEATVTISGSATNIRFAGAAGSSYYSDMSIDDVQIIIPANNDLAIIDWVSPVSGTTPSATMDVIIKVLNVGLATQDSFKLAYSVDGGTTIVNEYYNDTLAPGDTLEYTFTTKANMAQSGYYYCGAAVTNVGDNNQNNDSIFLQPYLCSPLNGTYTIGPDTNDNFNTFADAVFALENCGLGGPVLFNIDAGTYNEQVTIGMINNASAVNTVTFQSATLDSSSVIINYAPTSSTDNWTWRFDGSQYVILKDLTVKTSGSSYGRVIELANGASYNQIMSCVIDADVTKTSGNFSGIYNYNSIDNYNYIGHNLIKGGYYGLYMYGSGSTSLEKGNVVEYNQIVDYYYYAAYNYYQDSITYRNNYVMNRSTSSTVYGFRFYYCDANQILNNQIYLNGSSTHYGMYMYYCDSTTTSRGLVANNMISTVGSGTSAHYGIYYNYGNNHDFVYNSLYNENGSSTTYNFRIYNSSTSYYGHNVYNNNFINMGPGYAAYIYDDGRLAGADNNNFYAPNNSTLCYWDGANKADLAALKLVNANNNQNSVSMNPGFFSATDLHTNLIPFNNLGTPTNLIGIDIDGDTRDPMTPDIGADEFTPPANDVAIVEWISPLSGVNLNPALQVSVKVVNFGTNAQSNIPISFSIDGGATYTMETIPGPIPSQDTITYVFSNTANMSTFGMYNSSAYVGLVNDQNNSNDTIYYDIYACNPFSGNYTIGQGTGFDFASFTDAVNALQSCGVSGPVTLVADNDTFVDRFVLGAVPGASALNTITIKGSGNTTIWYEPSVSNERAIITLDGAKHVTIDSLNIVVGPNASYGCGVHLWHNADSNTISNCYVELNNTGSSSYFYGIAASNSETSATSSGSNAHYLTLENNTIHGGYYALTNYGSGTTSLTEGLKVINNTFEGYTYYGLYLYYLDAPEINGNTYNQTYSSAYYHNYLRYCDNDFKFINNTINMEYGYGVYSYYCDGSSSAKGLVANNMISQTVQNSTAYGMRWYSSSNMDIVYNTISLTSSSSSGYALYVYNSSTSYDGFAIYNNNLVNTGSGYAAYVNSNTNLDSADYNNFYSPSGNFVYWGGTRSDLAALQTAYTNTNQNSISVDPGFMGANDLHVTSVLFDDKGSPFPLVTVDYDGETRDASTPDIGADEFDPPADDLAVIEWLRPGSAICGNATDSVEVVVKNLGSSAQTNVTLMVSGTGPGGNISINTLIPSLASLAVDTFYVGTINTTMAGTYDMKAYCSLAADTMTYNDTIMESIVINDVFAVPYMEDFNNNPTNWMNMSTSIGTDGGRLADGALYVNLWSSNTQAGAYMENKVGMIPTNAYVTFDYKITDYSGGAATTIEQDTINLWASNDCGATGSRIYTIDTNNHLPSTNYQKVMVPLTAFVGDEVLFQFEMKWNNTSGLDYYVDIDNFGIAVPPVVDLGPDTSYCAGNSYLLDAGYDSAYTYTYMWHKAGSMDTLGMSQYYAADTIGTYYVMVTNEYGLMSTDTVNISAFAPTPVYFTGLNANYCVDGMSSTLTGMPTGGTFSGTGISGSTFDPNVAGAGTFDITYTYVDANMCSVDTVASTTVNALPIVNASADVTICEGTNTTLTAGMAPVASDIFFTQYQEGSSNNKALEIFNGTDSVIYLDNYAFPNVSNAPSNAGEYEFWNTFTPGDSILPGDVYVVAHGSADSAILAQADMTHNYLSNGDDGYALVKNDGVWNDADNDGNVDAGEMTGFTILDWIGDWNGDPGSGWDVAGVSNGTQNHTLIRKSTVVSGNTSWAAAAGIDSISSEWVVYPQDYNGDLGMHSMSGTVTYMWSNNISGMTNMVSPTLTTTYTVTATDVNTCDAIDSVVVTVNPMPAINLGADQGVCASDSLVLDAGAGFDYLWSTGDTTQMITVDTMGYGLNTVDFSVVITDANMCNGYDTIALTFNANPVVNISGLDTVKASWTVDLDAGTGFNTYTWSNGWTNQVLSFGANALTAGQDTMFSVDVTNTEGCHGYDTITFFVIDDVGFGEGNLNMDLSMYPNPSDGLINVAINGYTGQMQMNILDVTGKVVFNEQLQVNAGFIKEFDLSNLAKGVYNIQFVSQDGIKVQRLVVQ